MSAIPLTDEASAKVEAWKRAGKLVKVDPEKLRQRTASGFIWAGCGDGDHLMDVPEFLINKIGCSRRIHKCAWNGGGIRLDPTLVIPARYAQQPQCVEEIRDARRLKDIEILLDEVHIFCGAAGLLDLTIEQVFLSLPNGASYVVDKLDWDPKKIITLFRVCRSGSVRETYYANVSCADDVYGPLRDMQLI